MMYQFIESPHIDPYFNLALEQYVFDSMPYDKSYFMLWQNHNTIVVGKNQNTSTEINSDFVRRHNISVVRRLSGGGAVYHDLGNLNFSFITDAASEYIDFRRFCLPIVDALSDLGIVAELNGRNDITINGKKISGNSQYQRNGRVMHHGTLIFSSNLSMLSHSLQVNREKLVSNGVQSVISRVTNIAEHTTRIMDITDLKAALLRRIPCYADGSPYCFSAEQLLSIDTIRRERYATWEWNYGMSPTYSYTRNRRIEGCGTVGISLEATESRIVALSITGDFFGNGDIRELTSHLLGCRCEETELRERLCSLPHPLQHYIFHCSVEELVHLLLF